jgi:hypothetical protein
MLSTNQSMVCAALKPRGIFSTVWRMRTEVSWRMLRSSVPSFPIVRTARQSSIRPDLAYRNQAGSDSGPRGRSTAR